MKAILCGLDGFICGPVYTGNWRSPPTFSAGNVGSESLSSKLFRRPPLPTAPQLFATALGACGLFGWRRKRKNTLVFRSVETDAEIKWPRY